MCGVWTLNSVGCVKNWFYKFKKILTLILLFDIKFPKTNRLLKNTQRKTSIHSIKNIRKVQKLQNILNSLNFERAWQTKYLGSFYSYTACAKLSGPFKLKINIPA